MSDELSEQLSPIEAFEREELAKAFRGVLSSAEGKRVLFWVLEQAAIYTDAFAGEHTNATNYSLGLQAVGRKLISKFDEVDPRLYPRLLLDVAELKAMDRAALERREREKEPEDEE
ncbi:hypothetical protein RFN29_15135 [Mesorhizobium sp. VK22B]|uniref:DUF3144 domain-containing protein n=1 Tax=Mesorhizobium captivum TaxID=3072319 RepID=A0ABU4Z0Z4_9HYPH|nr:hypothetical protein [Mesorhizobium sp. VK22B]MDX8492911.1 hypothetical protein [Mesorhizobium sp. VK22B]